MLRRAPDAQRILKLLGAAENGRMSGVEYVAEGGYAYTFKAHDGQWDRLVAIKVAKKEEGDVIDEGFRVALLGHDENIVQVFGYVKYDQRERGLVMEFVEGGSLRQTIHQFRHDVKGSVDIALGVCRALQRAHGVQPPLVHRDVKPENILMRGRTPKLTDWGI